MYHKMMTQLFYHFALSCARERLTKLTKSILKQQAERKTETSKKLPTSAHLAVQTVAARTRRALKKENN